MSIILSLQVEAEKEEKYFNDLEKKEMMEEKMQSITELKTTVFTCKQVNNTPTLLATLHYGMVNIVKNF